jgi:hypothetical protein
MHKNAMKCNETLNKWCKNKHGASKIIDTLETYQDAWHIYWTPGEYPPVLTKELDERTFLCRGKRIRHPHGFRQIRWVDLVLSGVFASVE